MTELNQIYRCNTCGNIVEVLDTGMGQLVCCGKEMELLAEKTKAEELQEKHVPVIEKTAAGVRVKVGSVPHPMEPKHYIDFIEVIADGRVCRKSLKLGDRPEAEFEMTFKKITARAYCNIHGLWKS